MMPKTEAVETMLQKSGWPPVNWEEDPAMKDFKGLLSQKILFTMMFFNLLLNVVIWFNFISIGMFAQILGPKNEKDFLPNSVLFIENNS